MKTGGPLIIDALHMEGSRFVDPSFSLKGSQLIGYRTPRSTENTTHIVKHNTYCKTLSEEQIPQKFCPFFIGLSNE